MNDYLLLMHNDAASAPAGTGGDPWETYIAGLAGAGVFVGGSEIGAGECVRREGLAPPITSHLSGFIRVRAESLAQARTLLRGNPHYEAGGTVEIRELPRSG